MKAFFSPDYVLDLGAHVFPTRKFALVAERLKAEPWASPLELVEPPLAERSFLELAHAPEWVDKVLEGRLSLEEEAAMELPWSEALARAHRRAALGTWLACSEALDSGYGVHVGGGSHHAFADHGEGFCVFNDLACALRRLRAEGRLARAAVVDLDVHQGNGTAAIFSGEPKIATFSMHQEDIYPSSKPPSTLDIGLPAGTGDAKYLKLLSENLGPFLDASRPGLVLYQAGTDVYEGDLLGGLSLSREGIAARDEAVFVACARRGVPAAVTLGGGYARRVEETVSLHVKTIELGARFGRALRRG